jgi:hypothetical protein
MLNGKNMPQFTYDDIVFVRPDAPAEFRPGSRAWIIAVIDVRVPGQYEWLPPGQVYMIEFEDGDAIDIVENLLLSESSARSS